MGSKSDQTLAPKCQTVVCFVRMDLDRQPTIQGVRRHLIEHLGAPRAVFGVNDTYRYCSIAYFAPAGLQAPVFYVTVGLSLRPMQDERLMEALMVVCRAPNLQQVKAIRQILTYVAGLPQTVDDVIQVGDVIDAKSHLAPICQMDALLFVPPFLLPSAFHRVGLQGGQMVEMIWPMPVYAVEADYAYSQGAQALVQLFAEQRVDVTDLERGPVDCVGASASSRL